MIVTSARGLSLARGRRARPPLVRSPRGRRLIRPRRPARRPYDPTKAQPRNDPAWRRAHGRSVAGHRSGGSVYGQPLAGATATQPVPRATSFPGASRDLVEANRVLTERNIALRARLAVLTILPGSAVKTRADVASMIERQKAAVWRSEVLRAEALARRSRDVTPEQADRILMAANRRLARQNNALVLRIAAAEAKLPADLRALLRPAEAKPATEGAGVAAPDRD